MFLRRKRISALCSAKAGKAGTRGSWVQARSHLVNVLLIQVLLVVVIRTHIIRVQCSGSLSSLFFSGRVYFGNTLRWAYLEFYYVSTYH